MRRALCLANWRPGDGRALSLFFGPDFTISPPLTDPGAKADDEALLRFGRRVRFALVRFMTGSEKDRQALRKTRDGTIKHMRVRSTELHLSERGSLEYFHNYVTGNSDGQLGLFLALLLDPERSFGQDLRRCRLPGCGRFFLVAPDRRGGPIPAYCPDTDHQKQAGALTAKDRAKKYRANKALRELHEAGRQVTAANRRRR
jgi:hypothetical protein